MTGGAGDTEGRSRAFADRFEDMPIHDGLEEDRWGCAYVRPRDADNGIEEPDQAYWGGSVLADPDGTYHMYVATWPESCGHWRAGRSQLARATAQKPTGPFTRREDIGEPRGHNPEAVVADGRVGVFNNGAFDLAYADAYDGPWTTTDLHIEGRDGLANTAAAVRDDGSILLINRSPPQVHVADSLLGDYRLVTEWEYPDTLANVEDQEVWKADGYYHLVANQWSRRTGFYMISLDGVDWTVAKNYQAYVPGITRYEDGTNTLWCKMERIKVLTEGGRATHAYLAAADNKKYLNEGNDEHNDKTLAIPLAPLGGGRSRGPISAGSYRIENAASGLVMTVDGGMNEEGASVVAAAWREESGAAPGGHPDDLDPEEWETNWDQRWIASPVREGVYRLELQGTKKTDPQKMLAAEGSLVVATYDDGSDAHHWAIRENDDGTYRIENAATGTVATAADATAGADVVGAPWDGRGAQRWHVETPLSFPNAPAPPADVSASAHSDGSIDLSWSASTAGPSGIEPYYAVYVDGALDHETDRGETVTTVTGLADGVHELQVAAADDPYNESVPPEAVRVDVGPG